MKKTKYIICMLLAVLGLAGCGESLEDTYGDYAGDGRVRYVGKCSELKITPGWKRLQVTWQNTADLTVKNIKVTWTVDEVATDTLLDAGVALLDLKNLADGNYRIDIRSVDANGNESFPVTNYGRPYTENHEVVRTFTSAITKYFRVGDNLVFFTDQWNDNIVKITLDYTDGQGNPQTLLLDKALMTEGFHVIRNVSVNDPLVLNRTGKLEACPDTIQFEAQILGKEKSFTSDFQQAVETRYGVSSNKDVEQFNRFIETVQVLEFDHDMTSFEDVLHCPRLEKIVLGKNRYLYPDPAYALPDENSLLYDRTRSLAALQAASELKGLKIELYGSHYFEGDVPEYVTRVGDYPSIPMMNYISAEEVESITSSIEDSKAEPMLRNLVDNDPRTQWRSSPVMDALRSYDLTIKLKDATKIRGIKISQVLFDPKLDFDSPNFLPTRLIVKTSVDGMDWKNPTFVEENKVGKGAGEITLLPVSEGEREVKYIRVSLHDETDGTFKYVQVGDIIPYY